MMVILAVVTIFFEDGDYYGFAIEVYRNDFGKSQQIANDNELMSILNEYYEERDAVVSDWSPDDFEYRCESDRYTAASFSYRETGITAETIEDAKDAIKDFEFHIAIKDNETFETITYIGYLDFLEE